MNYPNKGGDGRQTQKRDCKWILKAAYDDFIHVFVQSCMYAHDNVF